MKRLVIGTLTMIVIGSSLAFAPKAKAESREDYCRDHGCYNYDHHDRGQNWDHNRDWHHDRQREGNWNRDWHRNWNYGNGSTNYYYHWNDRRMYRRYDDR